jgi:hypothetical protein
MVHCIFQMLMDPMGGIVMTNDGNAILREVCNIYNVHCLKNSYNYWYKNCCRNKKYHLLKEFF